MPQPIFINHTNHPYALWGRQQKEAALRYGQVVEIPFPAVPASFSEAEVCELACEKAKELLAFQPAAVLCQGEFTYCYHLVSLLKAAGVCVLAACSERVTTETQNELGQSIKTSKFEFKQFREYA